MHHQVTGIGRVRNLGSQRLLCAALELLDSPDHLVLFLIVLRLLPNDTSAQLRHDAARQQ